MSWSATPQTLDPLGGLTARYFALATTVVAAIVVAILLLLAGTNVTNWTLQFAALALFVGAVLINVIGVDPRFFPFGAGRHAALHGVMVLAFALDSLSRSGTAGGAWGAIALTILIALMGSFRPAIEIVLFATVSGLLIGVISWLTAANPIQTLGDVVPLVAVAVGAAGFSRVLVVRVSEWQLANAASLSSERSAIRSEEQEEVLQHRIELVDYRVGPYLEQILASGTLTPVDIARARGLATTLRTMMMRGASASWLGGLVDSLDDESTPCEDLGQDQRRALTGVLSELRASPATVAGSIRAVRDGESLAVTAELTGDEHGLRAAAYRAVLRSVFTKARVDVSADRVEITLQLG